MNTLIVENFRCFSDRIEIPLCPITLLVGENSSGKTSFLAAARVAEQIRNPFRTPDFNEEPFSLGSYDDIANYRGGKAGKAKSFWIGAEIETESGKRGPSRGHRFEIEYVRENGRPVPRCIKLKQGDNYANFTILNTSLEVEFSTPSGPEKSKITLPMNLESGFIDNYFVFNLLRKHGIGSLRSFDLLMGLLDPQTITSPPYAAAPIRAQPERIYQILNDTHRPQGEHVPVLLAQLYGHKEWENVREPLEKFASASGLFEEIKVKKLGKGEGSPFQIQVKLGGPPRNLVDVGYGVSQVLPVLVDLLRDKKKRMFLIQQPEVHLHPRAQAELGSLFVRIAKSHSKQLLIETHSDYMIDRIRTEIRNGNIDKTDVAVIYFEKNKSMIKTLNLVFDEKGAYQQVPPTYRSFFLEEERRYFGID